MKKCFLYLTLILLVSGVICGQTLDSAIDQARQIRLLEADRGVVRGVFHNFILNSSDDLTDEFSWDGIDIEVFYSGGECDSDNDEVWQTIKGNAHRIVITGDGLTVDKLSLDLNKFQKEQVYNGIDEHLIYHDKKSGIAVEVAEDEVESVTLFPPISTKEKTCETKYAKEFVSMASWFGSKKLEDRFACVLSNTNADVTGVSISHDVISALTPKQVKVFVTAVDPEGDVLTYNYTVTGGRVVGAGAKVVWDLAGVRPGTYTLTAAVDDGAGPIGKQVTKSVTIH